jgi:phospholipid/cholesterol/gamma-HCH transport system substrate-binding protein
MDSRREQALVGLFVVVATAILLATVFSLKGFFAGERITLRTYFGNTAGVEPGKAVRYSGSPAIGRVEQVIVDPQHPERIEVVFTVRAGTPVRKDSTVRISSLSALGDTFLEIVPGTTASPPAQNGDFLKSKEFFGINQLSDKLSELEPDVRRLIAQLNDRVAELKTTIANVNELTGERNRDNVSASLEDVRGLLRDNRPKVTRTLANIESSSERVKPLLEDLKQTVDKAKEALSHVDSMVTENRDDVRASTRKVREALDNVNDVVLRISNTLEYNSENIDALLDNMRIISDNLKQFTETIKQRPSTLIRSSGPPDRKPGSPPRNK